MYGGGIGGLQLNFDGGELHLIPLTNTPLHTQEASISMSDVNGNLLFFSNNCLFGNKEYSPMLHGEGLNPGLKQEEWCSTSGDPFQQSILCLPFPGDTNKYIIFHLDLEIFNFGLPGGSQFAPMNLYYSVVDMSQDNGLGEVIEKNYSFIQDTLMSEGLHAVQHANGRDWWILCSEYRSNCYYRILLDPWGPHLYGSQCLGPIWDRYAISGHTLFSSSGDKYVRSYPSNGLCIFDFDRCSGLLANPIVISLAPDTNAISSMALSPSGRFAYVIFLNKIYQYDLWSSDIALSKILVAEYDGFVSTNPTYFYQAQLGPDGRIYICSYGGTYFLHTINQPDSLGYACQVLQHGIQLPHTYSATMPNFPNFNLGAIEGSICDSLVVSVHDPFSTSLKTTIYPNPASSIINFVINSYSVDIATIYLYDIYGTVIKTGTIPIGSYRQVLHVADIPPGVYYWSISSESGLFDKGLIIIQH